MQKGGLRGKDLIFVERSYINRHLKIRNPFYFEALNAISKLDRTKHYENLNDEHLFYNPIFLTTDDEEVHERTLRPFYGNKNLQSINTWGPAATYT